MQKKEGEVTVWVRWKVLPLEEAGLARARKPGVRRSFMAAQPAMGSRDVNGCRRIGFQRI